jgi:ribosome-binding protein aMBF1 (putative translation factor)
VRDDLDRYISKRKKRDKRFAEGFESGYQEFKIGHLLRNARQKSGISQNELARRLRTSKSAISRIENHANDIRVSTLKKVAEALGKELKIAIS